jgi:Leucine-rich repeat (LRR) protein
MNFDLAVSLDILPFHFRGAGLGLYVDDKRLWTEGSIRILKSGNSDYEEKKSFKEFEALLPQLKNVTELEVGYRVSESFFESICQMSWLERLKIYQPRQKTLQPIINLRNLTHLQLGCNPGLDSLEPLTKLKRLKALGMDGSYKTITQLDPLAGLSQLEGLSLSGTDSSDQYYDSLWPLSRLKNLKYLGLAGVKTGDRSLDALCYMSQLKCLHIVGLSSWPKREYEKVHKCLPDLNEEDLLMAATNSAFQKKNRIK